MKRYVKSDMEIPKPPLLGDDFRFTISFACHILSLVKYPKSIYDYVKGVFEELQYPQNLEDREILVDETLVATNTQEIHDIIYSKVVHSSPDKIMECITILEDTLALVSVKDPLITYQVDIIIDIEKLGLI